jgi:hypothetical protein
MIQAIENLQLTAHLESHVSSPEQNPLLARRSLAVEPHWDPLTPALYEFYQWLHDDNRVDIVVVVLVFVVAHRMMADWFGVFAVVVVQVRVEIWNFDKLDSCNSHKICPFRFCAADWMLFPISACGWVVHYEVWADWIADWLGDRVLMRMFPC